MPGLLDGEALEQAVDRIVAEHISLEGPGLSILIGRGDRVLLKKGYGLADVGNRVPIRPDTRFIIASVTKQFTCMCIMMMKHQGLLSYDEPIARFFPDFPPYKDRVTVRHLMHQTSGLPEYLGEEYFRETIDGKVYDLQAILDLIKAKGELEFQPGERWRYCNSNYVLLGAIVERFSGMSLADFARVKIFEPLGMTRTLVGVEEARPEGEAIGYEYKSKTEFTEAPYNFSLSIGYGDGNIISTVEDLFKWGQALYTDRLLPLEVLAESFVPCRPLDPAFSRYGFGQFISERRGVREIHHGGAIQGYVTNFSRFTDEKLTVVIMANAAGFKLAEVSGAVADLLLADKMAPIIPIELPTEVLRERVGTYGGSPRGLPVRIDIEYSADKGRLVAVNRFGAEERVELIALGRDLFRQDDHTDTYLQFLRGDGSDGSGLRVLSGGMVMTLGRQ